MKTRIFSITASILLILACVFAFAACTPPADEPPVVEEPPVSDECTHENVGSLNKKVPATCTENGTVAHYVCADCGVILDSGKKVITETVIPATGHDYTESLAIGPNDNICVNGALIIKTCKTCGCIDTDKFAANEDAGIDGYHTVTEWTLITAPTYTETGLMEGSCSNKHCDVSISYVLPCINSEYYTMTSKIPEIPCAGEYLATFAFIGEDYFKYVITNGEESKTVNSLEFDVMLAAHNHTLNGNEMNLESYDRDTEGIEYCPECPQCTLQNTQGYFVCDVCTELIYIKIDEKHTIDESTWVVTVNPGCETEGEKQNVCTECGDTITESVPATGHDYAYTLSFAEDGKSYNLDGICKSCNATVLHEDVKGVVIEEFKATCKCSGNDVHKIVFADSSVDYSTTDISAQLEVPVEQLDHSFNGIKLTENGKYNITEYYFLEKYADTLATCSASSIATIKCDACGREDVKVELYKDHTPTVDPLAGCVDSDNDVVCKFCNTKYVISLAGTGHDIEAYTEIKAAEGENMFYIGGFCSKCCAEGEIVFETKAVELDITETKGSCTAKGSITYSYNGVVIRTDITDYAVHVLKGVAMTESVYVVQDYPGITGFGGAAITSCSVPADAYFTCDICKQTVNVQAVADHVVTEWSTKTAAGCESEGVKVGNCVHCGVEVEASIPATGHTYDYDFTLSTKTLVCYCIVDGCDHEYVLTRVKRVINEATCVTPGSIVYTGLNADGKTETFADKIEIIAHHIDGVNVNADGAYEITEGRVGALANVEALCEKSVDGYYICDGCGNHIRAKVYQPHIVENEADAEIVEPTCTANGSKTFCCSLCDVVVTVDEIPATGHAYELTVSTLPTAETVGEVIGVCHCGDIASFELPVIDNANYKAPTVIRETSCLEDGIYGYSYEIKVEDKSYGSVYFEIITSKFVYNEDCVIHTVDVTEIVTFIDPFGEELSESVVVTYSYFECPGKDCEINILYAKSFVYDENLFVFDFNQGVYVISLPEGEK